MDTEQARKTVGQAVAEANAKLRQAYGWTLLHPRTALEIVAAAVLLYVGHIL